ncbi:MAG: hypothetical protein K2K68_08060 [Duncaniella sp.]|nr:hypothetical protein [Duncaniella sp.]
MDTKSKRRLVNAFAVLPGLFFIAFGIYNLASPEKNIDNLFGVLMIIYGAGSIALFPDWKGSR